MQSIEANLAEIDSLAEPCHHRQSAPLCIQRANLPCFKGHLLCPMAFGVRVVQMLRHTGRVHVQIMFLGLGKRASLHAPANGCAVPSPAVPSFCASLQRLRNPDLIHRDLQLHMAADCFFDDYHASKFK